MIAKKKREIEEKKNELAQGKSSSAMGVAAGVASVSAVHQTPQASLSQMELARKIQEAKERIRSNATRNVDVVCPSGCIICGSLNPSCIIVVENVCCRDVVRNKGKGWSWSHCASFTCGGRENWTVELA
jgi:CO dehydrogenase/acetyl-CoA synthase beta subunit